MRTAAVWFAAGLFIAGCMKAQETELQLELMNGVGTSTSRQGDLVSARVLTPQSLQGDIAEGRITQVQSGAKLGGKSILAISFDTLRHGGVAIPITSQVKSTTNSKGQPNVDEEGRMIRRGSGNVAKAAGGTGLGAAIGAIAGGGKGAAIGALAGGAASIALIQLAADSPNITFAPGTRLTISAATRSGPPLASLAASTPPAPAPTATAAAAATPAPAPATMQPATSSVQPDLTAQKADFVPGERAVFFDDLTDMPGDAPPPHWKVRGGTAELRTGDNVRQLTVSSNRVYLTPNLTELPKNFTMEVDMKVNGHGVGAEWNFRYKNGKPAMFMRLATVYTKLSVVFRVGMEHITSQYLPMDFTQPVKQQLWLQNGRMRLYLNGTRIFDVNQIEVADLGTLEVLLFSPQPPNRNDNYIGFRSVRFAESTPDFSQTILSTGRYVTRGILFDTDCDQIRPESAPVIKLIAQGLTTNPALKLLIEGHTDSVGNAAHNLDLSKRRAEAVKAVLVAQFSIDPGRLSTAGLGATKPVDTNDTPMGRSQNRRVELVKQ